MGDSLLGKEINALRQLCYIFVILCGEICGLDIDCLVVTLYLTSSKRTVLSSVQCKMNSNTPGKYTIHANSTGQVSSNHLEHSSFKHADTKARRWNLPPLPPHSLNLINHMRERILEQFPPPRHLQILLHLTSPHMILLGKHLLLHVVLPKETIQPLYGRLQITPALRRNRHFTSKDRSKLKVDLAAVLS